MSAVSATLPQVFFPSVVAVNKQTGEIIVGPDALKPEVRRTSDIIHPIQPTNKVDKVGACQAQGTGAMLELTFLVICRMYCMK